MYFSKGLVAAYEVQPSGDELWQRLFQRYCHLGDERLCHALHGTRRQPCLFHLLRGDIIGLHAHVVELYLIGLVHLRMGELYAAVEQPRFAEDHVAGMWMEVVAHIFCTVEPDELTDRRAVGEPCDKPFLPRSYRRLVEAQHLADDLYECHVGRQLADSVDVGAVYILIRVVLQQVTEGVDAKFLAQYLFAPRSYARQEFYVLLEKIVHYINDNPKIY